MGKSEVRQGVARIVAGQGDSVPQKGDPMTEPLDLPAAEFSPCRTWRYVLRRRWASVRPVGFILLNPSTADEEADDPTIRRCVGFAKSWGAGGIVVGNLFALRSTDPRVLRSAVDPIGPGNDAALLRIANEVKGAPLICGWGTHGSLNGRGRDVVTMLFDAGVRPMALAITADGSPGHPLYLNGRSKPFEL